MKCPKCLSKETRVTCTEHHDKGSKTYTKRYCRCLNCKSRFRAIEEETITAANPGRKKGSFILNDYQCEMIGKNKYMLDRKEWAAIYKVSVSTVITAEKKFKIKYPEYLPKYKNALYDSNQMDFLYKAKSTVVSSSGNKGQP